ncbi:MAG: hypothetical protein IPJ16_10095 [Bacteroidales bacterium]|nr:hypothetical protein [Bacteroidales bacterium]
MATRKPKITRKRGEIKPPASKLAPKRDYRARIVVQFKDEIQLPYRSDAAKYIKEFNVGPWDQLVKKHPGLTIEPLFPDIDPKKLKELIGKAKEMDPTYIEVNFFNYFRVICPVDSNPETILKDLSAWKYIRNSFLSGQGKTPAVAYSNDEFAHEDSATPTNPYQRYLNDAPEGVSAKYVWDFPVPGSDGNVSGINFIDIEKGWTLNHNDLAAHGASCLFGTNEDGGRLHGSGVLGIICAIDNAEGCVGIVPNVNNVNVISTQDAFGTRNVAAAILSSLNYLGFGDVLLIEDTNTVNIEGTNFSVPIETLEPEFNAIRLATALGIIVIEPGGNGDEANAGIDFDTFELNNKKILKPLNDDLTINADFMESGAIIVTAAESGLRTPPLAVDSHTKIPKAPYGSRIDCYGWGENITTLGYGLTDYVHDFNGTSGAAAIVAGAVLSMQGMVLAEHGYKFGPGQMRAILRNPLYGTQMSRKVSGSVYQLEPVFMPDLHKFADQHLNLPPDIYMRDSLSDDGSPHAGAMSWSPDIILKNIQYANPTASFGIGSGMENNDNLSDSAYELVPNYLYFRALNQGGSVATGVKVTAFWSNPSTVITPGSLNFIGETDFPDIPKPVSGEAETLTVSNELIWDTVPVTGHYCFVAFVTCDQDPYFDPRKIVDGTWSWARYYNFIRNNNNVTWRNFNVIPLPPPADLEEEDTSDSEPAPQQDPPQEQDNGQAPPENLPKKGWVHIDFISPGLPGISKKMDLEIISRLPGKAIGILQAPVQWKREVFRGSPFVRTNVKRKKCYSRFGTGSTTRYKDIHFRADSKTPLRLYINVPEKLRNKNYTVAVRQMLDGVELGRVTYMLVPWKKKPKPVKPGKPVIKGKDVRVRKLK